MDEVKVTPQLDANRCSLAEQERNLWCVTVEHGITREQVLNPAFWAQFSSKLKPYDKIEVRCDDGTIYAELLVIQSERTWARVHVLTWHDLTTKEVAETLAAPHTSPEVPPDPSKEFEVAYKGAHRKWCVIRQSDKAVVREGEASRQDADLWLSQYQLVIA